MDSTIHKAEGFTQYFAIGYCQFVYVFSENTVLGRSGISFIFLKESFAFWSIEFEFRVRLVSISLADPEELWFCG